MGPWRSFIPAVEIRGDVGVRGTRIRTKIITRLRHSVSREAGGVADHHGTVREPQGGLLVKQGSQLVRRCQRLCGRQCRLLGLLFGKPIYCCVCARCSTSVLMPNIERRADRNRRDHREAEPRRQGREPSPPCEDNDRVPAAQLRGPDQPHDGTARGAHHQREDRERDANPDGAPRETRIRAPCVREHEPQDNQQHPQNAPSEQKWAQPTRVGGSSIGPGSPRVGDPARRGMAGRSAGDREAAQHQVAPDPGPPAGTASSPRLARQAKDQDRLGGIGGGAA